MSNNTPRQELDTMRKNLNSFECEIDVAMSVAYFEEDGQLNTEQAAMISEEFGIDYPYFC